MSYSLLKSESSDSENSEADRFDLSDEKNIWNLYTKYAYTHFQKAGDEPEITLMTPGLFCDYFSIHLAKTSAPRTFATYKEIIDNLADPTIKYSDDPCGPIKRLNIYKDTDGDDPDILYWRI